MNMGLLPWRHYRDAVRQTPGLTRSAPRYLERIHARIAAGRMDSWAYVALLEHLRLGMKVLVPPVSMVRNEGFAADATHTTRRPRWANDVPQELSDLPNRRPADQPISAIQLDTKADRYMAEDVFEFGSWFAPKKIGLTARRLLSR